MDTTKFYAVTQNKGRSYREIDVPNDELEKSSTIEEKLDLIFKYGQNDFQPRNGYASLSANDIIRYEDKFFFIASVGFKELNLGNYTILRCIYMAIEDTDSISNYRTQQSEYFRLRDKARDFCKEKEITQFF